MRKVLKVLVDKRFAILAVSGATIYYVLTQYHISLWWLLLAGVISGLIFGKVFCRWVCPMGLIMEIMMSMNKDGKIKQMYQYHKLGCPIAWVSGWLNKFSLFKIKLNTDSCISCGACQSECPNNAIRGIACGHSSIGICDRIRALRLRRSGPRIRPPALSPPGDGRRRGDLLALRERSRGHSFSRVAAASVR